MGYPIPPTRLTIRPPISVGDDLDMPIPFRTISALLAGMSFAACNPAPSPAAEDYSDIHVFRCDEPLPEFTLSADARPSPAEEDAACACVWDKLGPEGQRISVRAKAARVAADVSPADAETLTRAFGVAVRDCEG